MQLQSFCSWGLGVLEVSLMSNLQLLSNTLVSSLRTKHGKTENLNCQRKEMNIKEECYC